MEQQEEALDTAVVLEEEVSAVDVTLQDVEVVAAGPVLMLRLVPMQMPPPEVVTEVMVVMVVTEVVVVMERQIYSLVLPKMKT